MDEQKREIIVKKNIQKDFNPLSTMVHAQCDGYSIIATDSWYRENSSHHIEKICVNEKFPLIIASTGEIKAFYNNKIEMRIMDVMNKFSRFFKGKNIDICIDLLVEDCYIFMNDVELGEAPEKKVQFFITYWNADEHKNESFALEVSKNNEGVIAVLKYKDALKENFDDFMKFACFGTYQTVVNNSYHENESLFQTLKGVVDTVRGHIQFEEGMEPEIKRVGGNIQWAVIDNEGELFFGEMEKGNLLELMKTYRTITYKP